LRCREVTRGVAVTLWLNRQRLDTVCVLPCCVVLACTPSRRCPKFGQRRGRDGSRYYLAGGCVLALSKLWTVAALWRCDAFWLGWPMAERPKFGQRLSAAVLRLIDLHADKVVSKVWTVPGDGTGQAGGEVGSDWRRRRRSA